MPATLNADLRTQSSTLTIKLNGVDIRPVELGQVIDVNIEQDLLQPATFTIRLSDIDDQETTAEQVMYGMLDADRFKIGDDVEIWLAREDERQLAMAGQITSFELDADWDRTPILIVRGYDRSYRLHRQRKTRTFVGKTDALVLRQIAGEHGLSAQVLTTAAVTYPLIVQDNQTDWEFLRTRARRTGHELFVKGQQLVWRQPTRDSGPPTQNLGVQLQQARVRVSAPRQVQTVKVRGWDPQRKQAITATASTATVLRQIGEQRTGGQLATAAQMGTGEYLVTNRPPESVEDATNLAKASLDEIAGDFVQVEAQCLGDVRIQPGREIQLDGIGRRLSGTYYVTSVTHRITPDEGYVTRLVVSGRQPTSLAALLNTGPSGSLQASGATNRHTGVVVGIVTNNKDVEMGGRVKVKYPWLDDALESHWARIASPMAGNGRGFFWLPEINDEVLVAFEHGDFNRPYIVGGLWNGQDRTPDTAAQVVASDGKVNKRVIKSRSGHLITIDDTLNAEKITIADKTSKLTLTFDSPTSKITLKATGDLTLEATGNVLLKGNAVKVEATTNLDMTGNAINGTAQTRLALKGSASEVEGTATMKVKGATTDVEGTTLTNVKGAMIRLN